MNDITQQVMAEMLMTSMALAAAKQALDEGGVIELLDAACGYIFPTIEDKRAALFEEGIPLWVRRIAPY
jgi:hypothetical protein